MVGPLESLKKATPNCAAAHEEPATSQPPGKCPNHTRGPRECTGMFNCRNTTRGAGTIFLQATNQPSFFSNPMFASFLNVS